MCNTPCTVGSVLTIDQHRYYSTTHTIYILGISIFMEWLGLRVPPENFQKPTI